IEQGPTLADRDLPLGVVTDIVGMSQCEIVFDGVASHAGTTPLGSRSDALCAAAAFVLAVRDAARAEDGAVATVGRLDVAPGASNVIPARVRLSVDVRSRAADAVERLVAAVERLAAAAAVHEGCSYSLSGRWQQAPVPMDARVRAALARDDAGELPSGA